MLAPPTNEVAVTFFGIGAIAHLLAKSAPPAPWSRGRCATGPEKNIGFVALDTNAGVMSKPSGTDLGDSPSLKNDW